MGKKDKKDKKKDIFFYFNLILIPILITVALILFLNPNRNKDNTNQLGDNQNKEDKNSKNTNTLPSPDNKHNLNENYYIYDSFYNVEFSIDKQFTRLNSLELANDPGFIYGFRNGDAGCYISKSKLPNTEKEYSPSELKNVVVDNLKNIMPEVNLIDSNIYNFEKLNKEGVKLVIDYTVNEETKYRQYEVVGTDKNYVYFFFCKSPQNEVNLHKENFESFLDSVKIIDINNEK